MVNGSFPGLMIHAHKEDTVYVNVYNQGQYGVTIHLYLLSLSLSLTHTHTHTHTHTNLVEKNICTYYVANKTIYVYYLNKSHDSLNRVYNTLHKQSTTTKLPNLCSCRLRL